MSMDRQIVIHQPARLEIGAGTAQQVGEWAAGAKRILVLTVPVLEPLVAKLALPGMVHVITDVPPEPDDIALDRTLAAAAELKPDVIIGLGGGSVMDIAKLVSVLWDGEQALSDVIGLDKVNRSLSRLALIPTTAGTMRVTDKGKVSARITPDFRCAKNNAVAPRP